MKERFGIYGKTKRTMRNCIEPSTIPTVSTHTTFKIVRYLTHFTTKYSHNSSINKHIKTIRGKSSSSESIPMKGIYDNYKVRGIKRW